MPFFAICGSIDSVVYGRALSGRVLTECGLQIERSLRLAMVGDALRRTGHLVHSCFGSLSA